MLLCGLHGCNESDLRAYHNEWRMRIAFATGRVGSRAWRDLSHRGHKGRGEARHVSKAAAQQNGETSAMLNLSCVSVDELSS